ncbi:MAG TPA: ergothioneine biosynthesis protein EgtB [Caulobacteraceae bacterium]|jgi:ergothioneine biosynthesis protein EgtB
MRRYADVRAHTRALTQPLSAEDQLVQSMPDVSPTKWHLAHVSWFFETFLLAPALPGYQPFHALYGFLYNSYYEAVGPRWSRPERGLLSRPSLDEVMAYRRHVDDAMARLIATAPAGRWAELEPLIDLGLNHEQQHQELILMDIKHVLSLNPLSPAYLEAPAASIDKAQPAQWLLFDGGLVEIGQEGSGFAFDNEGPRHRVWLEPFQLASRLSTCGEYLAFIQDGGYRRPEFWLSEGWAAVQREGWQAPLYWREDDVGTFRLFTLHGERPLDPAEPVAHLSFYEADAFARWSGRRLPTEAEWETAAAKAVSSVAGQAFHPRPAAPISGLQQTSGELWQWTASAYGPYPRYRPDAGAIGEYNGKFMSGQMVLRGGCVATPAGHARPTYRNFFPPAARWAFSGVRLADDA